MLSLLSRTAAGKFLDRDQDSVSGFGVVGFRDLLFGVRCLGCGLFPCEDEQESDSDEEIEVGDIGDIGPDLVGAAVGPGDSEGEFHTWEWVDEIADASEDDAVVEVPESSCDDESESGVCSPVACFGPLCEEDDGDDHRDECEDDEEPALSGADAEDSAGVENEGELEDFGDDDDGFVVGDEVPEVVLSEDMRAFDVDWELGDLCERE